jgi:hypothetical protein
MRTKAALFLIAMLAVACTPNATAPRDRSDFDINLSLPGQSLEWSLTTRPDLEVVCQEVSPDRPNIGETPSTEVAFRRIGVGGYLANLDGGDRSYNGDWFSSGRARWWTPLATNSWRICRHFPQSAGST